MLYDAILQEPMLTPPDAAGVQFIVSTSEATLTKENHKSVRSHARRANGKRRKTVQLRSWIGSKGQLGGNSTESRHSALPPVASLAKIDGDFSALQLPAGIEPAMIQDLVKIIRVDQHGIYPYEICLQTHPVERGWFPYILSDICCLHSMMFCVRAFMDTKQSAQIGSQAALHYAHILRILQTRIDTFDQILQHDIYCDSSIMVITFLVTAAELTNDYVAMRNHTDGLLKIVSLRGGIGSLHTHNNLQVKVCRADLGLALRFGTAPRLFNEDIVWDCYVAKSGMVRCSHEPYDTKVRPFVDTLDTRLGNCWKDLHIFSCMSNLAYQTTRKLSPELYNEMIISILYRLLHLSYEADVLSETVRLGLLIFSSTLFMTRAYMEHPYERLLNLYRSALLKLPHVTETNVPEPVRLWLMMLYRVVAHGEHGPGEWQTIWLKQALSANGVETWPEAVRVLKSTMWVDFVHDGPGRNVFEAASNHPEETPQHHHQAILTHSD